jgi:predicted ester cyclase
MNTRKTHSLKEALNAISENKIMQQLKSYEDSAIESSFNDREETINDYIFNCGYTRKEAINAYNQTLEDERQY